MKNYKRFAAMAMEAVMTVGSGFSVMAAEGGATGSGDYEGYVEKVSVFTVEVPTDASATAGFNFFVDPNGLLAQTDYANKGGNAADFETDTKLYFTRTVSDTVTTKYGKESDAITFTNKSSYDVDVEVSASITVADDTTDPTIQLAIVSGSDESKITVDGGKLTGSIPGTDENFKVKWNSTDNKYEYGLKDDADEDAWKTYSFHLTGACGGTWTADQATVEPEVALTWKVTDPKAIPADDYVMTLGDTGAVSYTFGTKPSGEVTALTINGTDRLAAYSAGNITYSSDTGVFSVNATAATKTGLVNGGTIVVTIGGTDYTLTYTK